MPAGIKANSDGSAAIQVGGTDVITLTSGGAATFVTSPTTVQAGTAAAPSITFSGDTNTGIYSPGADTVGLTAGGTLVGSVGLGTTLALQGATSQSGTGITFPATQSASTNANTLDDYEEGTWTPLMSQNGNGGAGSWTSSTATGRYTKVGRQVFIEVIYTYTAKQSVSGDYAWMTGLPFVPANNGGYFYVAVNNAGGADTIVYQGIIVVESQIRFVKSQNTASPGSMVGGDFPAATRTITFQASYTT